MKLRIATYNVENLFRRAAILNLRDTARVDELLDLVKQLNTQRLGAVGDPEIATRTAAYEMAGRLQTAAPDLTCTTGFVVEDRAGIDGDAFPDTHNNVTPGSPVCFDIIPRMNTTVMPSPPRMPPNTLTKLRIIVSATPDLSSIRPM